jgi:2-keto-4-pentenoate hydratase/2-oxohepta-3-ene-1,7-dioic acid hydratase in catechol pathway
MRLVHLAGAEHPELALLREGSVVPLRPALPAGVVTLDDAIELGPGTLRAAADKLGDADGIPLAAASLAAPVLRPSKVLCIGMNYRDHAEEQGVELPDQPLLFAKFPSALTGPDSTIGWSPKLTSQVDWEAELAVVVGRRLRNVSAADASEGVFGYTAANDLSARDIQFGDGQWVRGKSLDGFLPLGPAVVTADSFDPSAKAIRSYVNGELMQDSSTDQLIFGVGEILSFLSRSFTLTPGDIVLTGTPAGVGAFRDPPVFLGDGDVVEIEIEGIGTLRNTMREVRD